MTTWSKVKVVGPLALYAHRFGLALVEQGYTDRSAAEHLRLMGHLSGWLASQQLEAAALSADRIGDYCEARRAAGYTARRRSSALDPLRDFLRENGVLAEPQTTRPASAEERLMARYGHYLAVERGLVVRVVSDWLKVAALFLAEHPGLAAGEMTMGAAEVTVFCARELPCRKTSAAGSLAAALRSFLRFLHLEGVVAAPLAQAVPRAARRQRTGLPRGVDRATVARMLASCDRETELGRRDYAVLLLLTRLGLRAGEVARLCLDDIDWRAGELIVHGKGGRHDRLPLPSDVGAAIVEYLRHGTGQARRAARCSFGSSLPGWR